MYRGRGGGEKGGVRVLSEGDVRVLGKGRGKTEGGGGVGVQNTWGIFMGEN